MSVYLNGVLTNLILDSLYIVVLPVSIVLVVILFNILRINFDIKPEFAKSRSSQQEYSNTFNIVEKTHCDMDAAKRRWGKVKVI
jgi:hypothetical protein